MHLNTLLSLLTLMSAPIVALPLPAGDKIMDRRNHSYFPWQPDRKPPPPVAVQPQPPPRLQTPPVIPQTQPFRPPTPAASPPPRPGSPKFVALAHFSFFPINLAFPSSPCDPLRETSRRIYTYWGCMALEEVTGFMYGECFTPNGRLPSGRALTAIGTCHGNFH